MGLVVGQKAVRSLTLTKVHAQKKVCGIKGDYNPLRFDVAFAAKTKFQRLVVQGELTTGILNVLLVTDMPSPGTVFLSHDWNFTAPVSVEDTIMRQAEILSIHETKSVTQLKFQVARQTRETVLEGEAWRYPFSRGLNPSEGMATIR